MRLLKKTKDSVLTLMWSSYTNIPLCVYATVYGAWYEEDVSPWNISQWQERKQAAEYEASPLALAFFKTFYQRRSIIVPPWTSPATYYLSPQPDIYGPINIRMGPFALKVWSDTEGAHVALISLLPGDLCLTTRLRSPREKHTCTH